jgi:hypothetical protein
MLEVNKEIKLKGVSKIGDISAKAFEATINTITPKSMVFNHYIMNYDVYKPNRAAVTADQSAFEDSAYALQEQLIAEQAAK